jgi:CubicO group peptidase (beta-lactamase class C family)
LKVLKSIKWLLLAVGVLVVFGVATLTVLQEPIPAADPATMSRGQVFDERYASLIRQVSENLDGYRRSLVAPSVSVAVAIHGELVWAEARGYADIAAKIPATPETIYAIGSVSKPLTAALTVLLWERGQLDIDAKVRNYVASFPVKQHPITLRQLLSHQAGIRHYEFSFIPPIFSESARNREFTSTEESLALFAEDPLLFEPDTDFNYSTYGYTLIGAAIENATGQSFAAVLKQYVLDPLEMRSTAVDKVGSIHGTRASDYAATFSKRAVIRAPETNSSYKWPGGGLVSTPTDLAVFGSALLGDRLLNEPTRRAMLTPRELSNGELNPQHYGLGMRIGGLLMTDEVTGEESIITLFNHGGTRSGSTAILLIVPDHELVVAMTVNVVGRGGSGPLTSVAAKVARQFIHFEATRSLAVNP